MFEQAICCNDPQITEALHNKGFISSLTLVDASLCVGGRGTLLHACFRDLSSIPTVAALHSGPLQHMWKATTMHLDTDVIYNTYIHSKTPYTEK